MSEAGGDSVRVVAIVAAYNEEDIIGPAIAHLAAQGVKTYVLDDGSTDETVAAARAFEGRGLIGIESLPPPAGGRGITFSLTRILERKASLAREIEADWLINHDADEFRESPWPHLSLAEAIGLVDRLGFNAIDFEVLNFVPEGDWEPGTDPRAAFRRCVAAGEYDRLQVRCWKKTAEPVDLESTAGHDVQFAGRRVFPIRFPLRHYPLRGAAHARRKVLEERVPRFDAGERARGWHVQYDALAADDEIGLPGAASALPYDRDAVAVSAQVRNRLVEAAAPAPALAPGTPLAEEVEAILAAIALDKERVPVLDAMLEACRRDAEALRADRDEARHGLDEASKRAQAAEADARSLRRELDRAGRDTADLVRRMNQLYASRSWRITRPLRAIWRLFGGR